MENLFLLMVNWSPVAKGAYNQLQKEQQLVDDLSWRKAQSRTEKRENVVKRETDELERRQNRVGLDSRKRSDSLDQMKLEFNKEKGMKKRSLK